MDAAPLPMKLEAQPLTGKAFQAFGQVIFAQPDGAKYGPDDAQLQLENGIPRFYIMRLTSKGRKFHQITRHLQCTQCLGSLEGKDWLMAVAPASTAPQPLLEDIRAFHIPGNCFIKLNLGTWHAGPYFDQAHIDFYNLELSDTNEIDHDTCDLLATYNTAFEIVRCSA